jgi:hypothetical protein
MIQIALIILGIGFVWEGSKGFWKKGGLKFGLFRQAKPLSGPTAIIVGPFLICFGFALATLALFIPRLIR